MRMIGRLVAFFVLVFSAHWALLALNPGVTEMRIRPATSQAVATSSLAAGQR